MTHTALILGASGKIGRNFTTAFQAAGWQTRAYKRGTDMARAAQGCAVIVNGMNPPNYHDWDRIIPQITAQVLDAARASGATVLFPGNVYVYGAQPGPWSEHTPHAPCSRKGRIRAEAEARYRDAARDGVQTIILRAGDFMDAESDDSVLQYLYLRNLTKGRVTAPADPDVIRAHAWLPDMARAGVMLAQRRASLPAFCDVPFPGHAFSARQLKDRLERLTGLSLRFDSFPWWAMRLTGPVWELARELGEMRYLYETPHQLDGTHLHSLLPDWQDTPLDQVLMRVLGQRSAAAA